MAFNYSKLNGRIKEILGTQSKFAEKMNLSERTISLKLNGKIQWKQEEIMNACSVLGISNDDVLSYFFTLEVQN